MITLRNITFTFFICLNINLREVLTKQNVMMIIVDDLRSTLGCYGDTNAYTPNIDLLAKQSVLFTQAYAQQALCAPSRNSFLTSRRPDTLKLYDFYNYWRDKVGNFTTLPEYLKNNGYTTMSIGKVFHPGQSSNGSDDSPYSWSKEPFHPLTDRYKEAAVCKFTPNSTPARNIVCPVHVPHMPNRTLPDIETLNAANTFIRDYRNKAKPFFLAVGFQKPHIPLKYPRKYQDHHPLEKFDVPDNYEWSNNVSHVAYNPWNDLRERHDIKKLGLKFPYEKIPPKYAKLIIQSYYAAVTYIDDLIGLLMKQLTIYNLQSCTTVILISDHGWSLGEHGEWAKYSNFDVALRVPVIVSIPGVTYDQRLERIYCKRRYFQSGIVKDSTGCGLTLHSQKHIRTRQDYVKADSMIELVDIFPTIADIVNLPIPMCSELYENQVSQALNPCSEGVSFLPIIYGAMSGKNIPWKTSVFGQYPRPGVEPTLIPNSDEPRLHEITVMGYTIKTRKYRYTEWLSFNSSTEEADWNNTIAEELYSHEVNTEEKLNLVYDEEYLHVKNELKLKLKYGWRKALPQYNGSVNKLIV